MKHLKQLKQTIAQTIALTTALALITAIWLTDLTEQALATIHNHKETK